MIRSSGGEFFNKTVCSICYEDLKPVVEDLQAISICGHVFHELCLQQWFEYCTSAKKQTCPVCKQICSSKNVARLYFQSLGDPNDTVLPRTQNVHNAEDDPELLRREVKRLQAKVSGFDLALDRHQKEVKELSTELRLCKEQLTMEVMLKSEALKQRESIKEMLLSKSSELAMSNLECSRLNEKNLALAKELAALKLVSDCNLEEDEILKLASLGNEANSKDAIDVLKKSLVIRNKSYKELMAKCNTLGRGEARSVGKLEKAKEKITKLKTRVQELEIAIEAKDNEVLRMLKASKSEICNNVTIPSANKSPSISFLTKHMQGGQKEEQPTVKIIDLGEDGVLAKIACGVEEQENKLRSINNAKANAKVDRRNIHCEHMDDFMYLTDEDVPEETRMLKVSLQAKTRMATSAGFDADRTTEVSGPNDDSKVPQLRTGAGNCMGNNSSAGQGGTLLLQDIRQVQPLLDSRTEMSSAAQLSECGDRCFEGGLLGPDGATRYLGKWCKRLQKKESKISPLISGSLIAEGADGRGGRIKVLRSPSLLSADGLQCTSSAKKCKLGTKTSLQSQGCLQIEHFFGRANHQS
ncbi:hypothetical protein Ancab_036926 [Ancistrocladus abbreviatus]